MKTSVHLAGLLAAAAVTLAACSSGMPDPDEEAGGGAERPCIPDSFNASLGSGRTPACPRLAPERSGPAAPARMLDHQHVRPNHDGRSADDPIEPADERRHAALAVDLPRPAVARPAGVRHTEVE